MKKWLAALLLIAALLCACVPALADEAENITEACRFAGSDGHYKYTMMYDGKYTTHWRVQDKQLHPWITIQAPQSTQIYGLYICFAQMPESYEIQVKKGSGWDTYCAGDTSYMHAYVAIPEGAQAVRLYVTQDTKFQLDLNEVFVFGKGNIPDWVQLWEPTPEESDILLISTHPDDDLIFFCGAIPTYAVERGNTVAVCYYTYSNTTRRSELLNALWSMGYRQYPIIGEFPDRMQKTADDCYKTAGGKTKVQNFFADVIKQTRPQVIVTHDVDGEYGHGQHKMVADAVQRAYDLAAQGENAWQAQKLYLHLWSENQINVDWDVPLSKLDGKTGRELAIKAFTYHVTQDGTKYDVEHTGVEYDNECFGLCRTEVGPDVEKNDFMENLTPVVPTPKATDAPENAQPEPVETEVPADPIAGPETEPTTVPAPDVAPTAAANSMATGIFSEDSDYLVQLPALNAKGYLDEGEFIYASEEDGVYIYIDQTNRVVIERKYDAEANLTWFDTEIWVDTEAGEYLKTYAANPNKPTQTADVEDMAKQHKLAFAMNTDYFIYRISSTRPMGITIRDGKILYNKPYKGFTTNFPNLATLAFYPDGNMEVNESWEVTAEEYLERGAVNVYSFGPILLENGEYNEWVLQRKDSQQPRCAIGMIEPGHYIVILCEGRVKRSSGVTIHQLMYMMEDRGCTLAMNLDGGQTAAITFMGKRINQIGKYVSGNVTSTKPRKTTEVLGVGVSDQVGVFNFD